MAEKPKAPTELDFLTSLERGEVVTQMRLSKRIDISIGLVNALLKRAIHRGYVKAKSAPYKRYAYYLTPRGFSEKSRLVAAYLDNSLAFFRTARQEYGELFLRAQRVGIRRFVFVGGGELAEIALLAAREARVEIVGIFDRESKKDQFHGIPIIRATDDLAKIGALVITDARAPQQTFNSLRETFSDLEIFAPPFLRITRAPLSFKPKVAKP